MSARADLLAASAQARGLDALLVTYLPNVRYLTGYTGTSGMAVVGPDVRAFVTDFRYVTQAREEVSGDWHQEMASGELLSALGGLLAAGELRLGYDDAHLSVKSYERLAKDLGTRIELVAAGGLVEDVRSVKDDDEVARIRAACELADAALSAVLERGLAGRTETQVALDLEFEQRRRGASASSFPAIIASADHGSLPHAQPRDVEIARDVLVTIDWGAIVDGYCSDCTRTYATGEGLSDEAREVYALVAAAQLAGLAAVEPGRTGREVDGAARALIDAAGHADHFGHGLGHGVGLEIHEAPRLSQLAPETPLLAGQVVSVEPGVYVPGRLGVRIEDLVVIRDGGPPDILTGLSKSLTVV
jgi:Xaa-Pro aminopeptidase